MEVMQSNNLGEKYQPGTLKMVAKTCLGDMISLPIESDFRDHAPTNPS